MRLIVGFFVLATLCRTALAEDVESARLHYQNGLAAYALEHFGEAADEYEKAFALKTDPALLYNAAQAHRLAGHYDRALKLYQSYLRIFGKRAGNQREVQRHIHELQLALDQQKRAQESPPTDVAEANLRATPPPSVAESAEHAPEPAAAPAAGGASLSVTAHPADRAPRKRTWIWGVVVGGVVAVGLGVGLGVGLTQTGQGPSPSFGATRVQ